VVHIRVAVFCKVYTIRLLKNPTDQRTGKGQDRLWAVSSKYDEFVISARVPSGRGQGKSETFGRIFTQKMASHFHQNSQKDGHVVGFCQFLTGLFG
jgi:hypothetical protein